MSPRNGNERNSERWEVQMRHGALELAILGVLWQERLYGLDILRRLSEVAQLELAEGTVYPILARLKAEGLLNSEWVDAGSGHPRKYYWLTPAGRKHTREVAQVWREFSSGVSAILQPVLQGDKS